MNKTGEVVFKATARRESRLVVLSVWGMVIKLVDNNGTKDG
jgi:hypothetical protein